MSTAQMKASKMFLDAMGPMIYEEQMLNQVILYINSLHKSTTISQETFDDMRTIDDLDSYLEARIRKQFHRTVE